MSDKYNLEIEQCILGSLMTTDTLILRAIERKITAKMFYKDSHKNIYSSMILIINKGLNIDKVTLVEENNSEEQLNKLGGITYINNLTDTVPSVVNFDQWLDILEKYYKKRRLLDIANTIHSDIENDDILNKVENKLLNLHENNVSLTREEKLTNMLEIQEKLQKGEILGLKTGINFLDSNKLGGFHKKDVITIIARSGVGKSTLAIQIALNMINNNYNAIYISNEMDFKQVMDKMIASQCSIEIQDIRNGDMTDDEYLKHFNTATKIISRNNFDIIRESNINSLIATVKLYKLKNKLDVIFIDYINLILDGAEGENTTYKIGDAMTKLKNLAMDLNIAVVVLAQVKTTVDKTNGNKEIYEKITSADIQDSARIEQFSNVVLSLYRNMILDNKLAVKDLMKEDLKNSENNNKIAKKIDFFSTKADKNPNCANITINKSRFGEKTTGAVKWEGEYSRICDFERSNKND